MKRLSAIAIALMLSLPAPAPARDLTPVDRAELSARLHAAALAEGDAVMMAAGASLRRRIDPEEVARDGADAAPDAPPPLGWQDKLASARDLAGDDVALLAVIDDIAARGTRGVVSGPVYSRASIRTGGTNRYPGLDFRGGEFAQVYLEAREPVNLVLRIYDSAGRTVCADTSVSHIAHCYWVPSDTDRFTLVVENRGGMSTAYALMTN